MPPLSSYSIASLPLGAAGEKNLKEKTHYDRQ